MPIVGKNAGLSDTDAEHVAVLLPNLSGGGAQRAMLNLARCFAERGLTVDLVVQRAAGPLLSQVSDKIRLVDLEAKRMAFVFFPLVSYLRRERPHYILSGMSYVNVIAILAKKLAKVDTRIVISEHNTISASSKNAPSLLKRYLPPPARQTYLPLGGWNCRCV